MIFSSVIHFGSFQSYHDILACCFTIILKLSLFNSLYNLYISRTLSYLAYNYKHFIITNIFESGLKRIDFQSAVCNNTNIVRDGNKVSLTFGEGESTAQCLKAELVDSNDKTLVSKRLRTTADSCKC